MHSVKVFSAVLAFGSGFVIGDDCSEKEIKIKSAQQAIDCDDVFEGNIVVDKGVSGQLSLDGPKQVKGDITIKGVKGITAISSSSINSIGGAFDLSDLGTLQSINMQSLKSVGNFSLDTIPNLDTLSLGSSGSGITKASSVLVHDTLLKDMSAFDLDEVDSFIVSDNSRLNSFDSDLKNVTSKLYILQNGNNAVSVNMTKLQGAGEVQLLGIENFDAPSLETITDGLKFDSNPSLKTFKAPKLSDQTGTITFSKNDKLMNVSFPILKKIKAGDITLNQNKKLEDFSGFPKLETIEGSLRLKGAFETVSLPKLGLIKGAVEATSTTKNSTFCDFFKKMKDDDNISGSEKCSFKNEKANDANADVGDGEQSDGSGSGDDDEGNAAGVVGVNMAMVGLAVFGGLMQLL